ncbi:hypothetical protein [Mycobacterium sp. shizuoka-1]|uniref:SCO6745 family protein n=1 Tax=Mycobacterium sp. shizuoka-1 TaxID=2039281 RepID=UPI000C062FE1|nr:hypothetical protein [Mycobacterium sp. shizuoka-1]GAY14357.1 hypothetical protein MSZK_10830 [Mycobacterium sp. shizuoka-1]
MASPAATLARRLWESIEPVHAAVYFDDAARSVAVGLGMSGYWMGYFSARSAPLGAMAPGPVAAMFYSFAPGRVARALPEAWQHADPATVLQARIDTAVTVLRPHLEALSVADLDRLAALLETAAQGCGFDGRPLAAGWSQVPLPESVAARIWLAATVLREHRGDGHVLACVREGLGGLDAVLTHVATGAVTRDVLQRNRGWSDQEWCAGLRRLRARKLIDVDGRLTRSGGMLRREIEDRTDILAGDPVTVLGPAGVQEVIDIAAPLSARLFDCGAMSEPNPIGVPRPRRSSPAS